MFNSFGLPVALCTIELSLNVLFKVKFSKFYTELHNLILKRLGNSCDSVFSTEELGF